MARIGVEGGAAFGSSSATTAASAEASSTFSPGNAAGWAFYLFVVAVAAIFLVAYSSSR